MNLEFLRAIREYELSQILPFLPPSASIVELGAGAGWQAKRLASLGHSVIAFDLPTSNYASLQEYHITDYNGKTLPLNDLSTDCIFSSNVLEHVEQVQSLLRETVRVLKEGGVAIHLMPTPTWRLWSIGTHHAGIIKEILGRIMQRLSTSPPNSDTSSGKTTRTLHERIRRMLIPPRHGETGTMISELWRFRSSYWCNEFTQAGFTIEKVLPSGLMYSGALLLGSLLPLHLRHTLSKILGSSCTIYVMRKHF